MAAALHKPNSHLAAGLFRSSTPRHLLHGFARIFDDTPSTSFAAGSTCSDGPSTADMKLASDVLFNASAEAEHVEIFISHSWSAGRWSKYLALCTYFNLAMAVKCAVCTWLLVVVVLLGRGGMTSLGGSPLALPCLVYLPMSIFFLVLLLGHEIMGSTPSLWLDKLCIHQFDPELKAEQISALLVFVARSERMLILWDDTYFERLWCNAELAIRARYGGAEKVEVLPLWLAPWLLGSIVLDLCSVTIFDIFNFAHKWEDITKMVAAALGEQQQWLAMFCTWGITSIAYFPTSIPCFFSFRMKLRSHQLLLDQMAAFDVKNAKCTVPADREPIEQHVREVFNEWNDLEQEAMMSNVDAHEVHLQRSVGFGYQDPLQRFNAYVRTILRDGVLTEIGDELFVPWRTCLVAFLPMIFYASVNVLGCDNGPCEVSYKMYDFRSPIHYMLANAVSWTLSIALAFPLAYPILLRMLKFAFSLGDGPLQQVTAFLFCPLAFTYNYICSGLIGASLLSLVMQYSVNNLVFFVTILALLAAQSMWLFSSTPGRSRKQMPCRCIERQTYAPVGDNVRDGEPGSRSH